MEQRDFFALSYKHCKFDLRDVHHEFLKQNSSNCSISGFCFLSWFRFDSLLDSFRVQLPPTSAWHDEMKQGRFSRDFQWDLPARPAAFDCADAMQRREATSSTIQEPREGCADRGKCGDPAGDIVRRLCSGEETDEPLVCFFRAGRRVACERIECSYAASSRHEAFVRPNMPAQARG